MKLIYVEMSLDGTQLFLVCSFKIFDQIKASLAVTTGNSEVNKSSIAFALKLTFVPLGTIFKKQYLGRFIHSQTTVWGIKASSRQVP